MTRNSDLTRRRFIQGLTAAAASGMLAGVSGRANGATTYTGKFLINLQLTGGLDVTSFGDPKTNVVGKPVINNWAKTDSTLQAGNIPYAPFAANQKFFEKYYRDILLINGVDAQTNSHTVKVFLPSPRCLQA